MTGVHPDGSLSFCQLCRILMTYCVFSKEEILLCESAIRSELFYRFPHRFEETVRNIACEYTLRSRSDVLSTSYLTSRLTFQSSWAHLAEIKQLFFWYPGAEIAGITTPTSSFFHLLRTFGSAPPCPTAW